ncbi:MAG: UbiA family prenyltransferase [Ignavibacterium sp.]|jgi:geranylgeranylglycerol-phosphate geranylgeranyltransferase|nr:UbiA family prenyltransferase [Ignavibacterium sp.]MDX9713349.1 UbiA family prenyltransferase [Ignavibacteriaceae bacterium]MEB2355103.1 UbiA family prenyltransferase [Ignavibacteriales bacterium]GIK21467.1 MAG: digeranylgeranylglyceryl phosphate synthase [Ignavibacteriota bacterium]
MKKLKGLIRLIRFELPLAAAICVMLGQLFALGKFAPLHLTLSAAISVFLISASILISNDYFDVETDRINAPHRPIPSNAVTSNEALLLASFLLITGIILSYTISIEALLFSIGLIVIGLLYNRKFKRHGLTGNLMVSFSVGMTFIFGGLSVGLPFNKIVLFFALIAALVDLGEEIAADSMDVKGDLLIDSNSIAIKYGKEKALRLSGLIFTSVILLSLIPFLLEWFKLIYLLPIAVMDFFIGISTYKLIKSKNEEGRKYIRLLYLGATFGLFIFLFMRLIGV